LPHPSTNYASPPFGCFLIKAGFKAPREPRPQVSLPPPAVPPTHRSFLTRDLWGPVFPDLLQGRTGYTSSLLLWSLETCTVRMELGLVPFWLSPPSKLIRPLPFFWLFPPFSFMPQRTPGLRVLYVFLSFDVTARRPK